MTHNQIEYWSLKERERSARAVEYLRGAELGETIRHNQVSEANDRYRTDMSYAGTVYSANMSYASSKYSADMHYAASKYSTDTQARMNLITSTLNSATQKDVARVNSATSKYTTQLQVDQSKYATDKKFETDSRDIANKERETTSKIQYNDSMIGLNNTRNFNESIQSVTYANEAIQTTLKTGKDVASTLLFLFG